MTWLCIASTIFMALWSAWIAGTSDGPATFQVCIAYTILLLCLPVHEYESRTLDP
jgi:hypothetical protein